MTEKARIANDNLLLIAGLVITNCQAMCRQQVLNRTVHLKQPHEMGSGVPDNTLHSWRGNCKAKSHKQYVLTNSMTNLRNTSNSLSTCGGTAKSRIVHSGLQARHQAGTSPSVLGDNILEAYEEFCWMEPHRSFPSIQFPLGLYRI